MSEMPKILFVDDEERIVNLLKFIFKPMYEVFTATNGHDALSILESQHIHVIVSDQRMPEMLGIELLSRVRECSPRTMRILLTGYSDLSAIVSSVNDGEVFRYINKPWDQEELKNLVAEASAIALASESSIAAPAFPVASVAPTTVVEETVVAFREAKKNEYVSYDVLVIDESEEDRKVASSMLMLENVGHVYAKASIEEALKLLESSKVSVIVIDAMVQDHPTLPFLNILKQQYPLITTVLTTEAADSDTIIKLINQAQICRFVQKPLRRATFDMAMHAALSLHERLSNDPKLSVRYKVEKTDSSDMKPFAGSLQKVFANLKGHFKLFA